MTARSIEHTAAIRLSPNDAKTYYNRGWNYEKKGDNDSAIADYAESIRLDPKHAETYYNRGWVSQKKGEAHKAIADFTKAIRSIEMRQGIPRSGIVRGENGDLGKAIADCTEAIRLDPKGRQTYLSRGCVYGNKGEYDKAGADFSEAIRLNPKYAKAYCNRGGAFGHKGENAEDARRLQRGHPPESERRRRILRPGPWLRRARAISIRPSPTSTWLFGSIRAMPGRHGRGYVYPQEG